MSAGTARRERLRVTPRAILELGQVYQNPLDALRELIQNALDAGATRIDVRVDPERGVLVFEHDGEPITGEYLEAFLTVGTDFKARRGGYIGMYGIGRLAWVMLGDRAVIETGPYRIVWDASRIDEVAIEPLPEPVRGVRWIIRLKPEVAASLRPETVVEYLSTTYFGSVPVYVNGARVAGLEGRGLRLLYDDGVNRVYLVPRGSELSGVIVKGPFRVGEDYALTRLLVVTSSDAVRLNPAREIVKDDAYDRWKATVLLRALEAVRRLYGSAARAYEELGDLPAAWARRVLMEVPPGERAGAARRLLAYVPVRLLGGEVVWGDALDPERTVYVTDPESVDDTTVVALRRRGYRVVLASDWSLQDLLEEAGARKLEDVGPIVRQVRGSPVTAQTLKKLEQAYKTVKSVLAEVVEEKAPHVELVLPVQAVTGTGFAGGRAEVRVEGGEVVIEGDAVERIARRSLVRGRVVGVVPGTEIAVVEVDDENVMAFTDGERVYVNAHNPLVREMLELTKRLRSQAKIALLWAPILVHEILHTYGLDHTSPEWRGIFEETMARIIIDYLRSEQKRSKS